MAPPPIDDRFADVTNAVVAATAEVGIPATHEDLSGRSRKKHRLYARHLRCFILWAHYDYGPTEIGKACGINHATVIHSCSAAVRYIEWDGWAGRSYVKAIEILGLAPLDYVHPRVEDRVVGSQVVVPQVKSPEPYRGVKKQDGEDGYIKPMNWTEAEISELNKLNEFPGGVPLTIKGRKNGAAYTKGKGRYK